MLASWRRRIRIRLSVIRIRGLESGSVPKCDGSGTLRATNSVANPGWLSRIPDPTFFHPGSSSKNLSILTPKKPKQWFLSPKKYDPGCSSPPDPDADFLPIPDPGSRGQKGTRSRIPDPDPQHWLLIFWNGKKNWNCNFLYRWIPYSKTRSLFCVVEQVYKAP